MNSSDFARRFAPGYLITGSNRSTNTFGSSINEGSGNPSVNGLPTPSEDALKQAIFQYSSPIITELKTIRETSCDVYTLQDAVAKRVGVPEIAFDQFSSVLDYLERERVIQYVARDVRGNHKVKLAR